MDASHTGERPFTVLFVDDEALVRRVGERMLTRLGYRVMLADDGEEACRMYEAHQREIDLVILDLSMPQMNGEDTFHKIQQVNKNVRVIISSGCYSEDRIDKLIAKGVIGFVQKPFDFHSLRGNLEPLLRSKTCCL